MSWVAEAKAAMMNSTSVSVNRLMGVWPEAMSAGDGLGSVSVSSASRMVSTACMVTIHQRLVFTTSTSGLQIPFRNQGK